VLYLFGDGSHADKRGTKNPVAQKGRTSQHHPWFFGIRFALLIATWDVYRLPVAFRLIRVKIHPQYQKNELSSVSVTRLCHTLWALKKGAQRCPQIPTSNNATNRTEKRERFSRRS
jgi:hypothetical protein